MRHIAFALFLYLFNYPITELVAGDNIDKWWECKLTIVSLWTLFLVLAAKKEIMPAYGYFLLDIFLGVLFSDIIDRVAFNIYEYRINDFIGLVLSIIYAVANYNKLQLINLYGKIKRHFSSA